MEEYILKLYLDEALRCNEYLKIINRTTNKKFEIMVKSYDNQKLYYYFKGSNLYGSIYKSNIASIQFSNVKKQLDFVKNISPYSSKIDELSDYFMKCLNEINGRAEKNRIKLKDELFKNMFDSLYQEKMDNLLLRYLLGKNGDNEDFYEFKTPLLVDKSNISQKRAIQNALNNKVSVIEGPPGTGKTTTILSIICNLIIQGKKVVVVSKNNTAVDNIIEDFRDINIPQFYVRFGKKEIMDDLKLNAEDKILNFENELNNLKINTEDLEKLKILQDELLCLEEKANELVELKNLIVELENQKKFIDKTIRIYDFDNILTDEQKSYICNKNAKIKKIDRLIKLVQKEHYNIFEKLLIKYRLCLNINDVNEKLLAIIKLLEQLYIDNEIKRDYDKLEKEDLVNIKKRIKQVYDEYKNLSLNYFNAYLKTNINISSKDLSNCKNVIQYLFNTYPLILTTADGFLFNFKDILKSSSKIDCVIIDESSQCDILTGLPLLYLAKKIVVVGDSKQLGAITNLQYKGEVDDKYRYNDNNFLNSIKQVFNPPTQVLYEHYRCDYKIINFCNKYYYDNKLIIYSDNNENAMGIINADKFKGAEKKGSSYINKREIKTIESCVSNIDNTFVITPFNAQANLLAQKYNKNNCGTIHCFQGKGADEVYFSTVFNNFDYCVRHVKGKCNLFKNELVNVAVSRAKKKFVLVCDKNFFEKNSKYVPDIKNLIDYIGVYGSEIEDTSVCIYDNLYKNMNSYKPHGKFDNEFEEKLYDAICKVIDDKHYKCYMKLFLSELVQDKEFLDANPDIYRYILNGSHADFTIIDTRINKPVLVIELDGKYHDTEVQKRRDEFKKIALEASNISIFRTSSKDAIDIEELENILKDKLEYNF